VVIINMMTTSNCAATGQENEQYEWQLILLGGACLWTWIVHASFMQQLIMLGVIIVPLVHCPICVPFIMMAMMSCLQQPNEDRARHNFWHAPRDSTLDMHACLCSLLKTAKIFR